MQANDPTFNRDLTNHWMRFGPTAMVEKVGNRKWGIRFSDYVHPGIFTTKRAAVEAVNDWVCALSRRS